VNNRPVIMHTNQKQHENIKGTWIPVSRPVIIHENRMEKRMGIGRKKIEHDAGILGFGGLEGLIGQFLRPFVADGRRY